METIEKSIEDRAEVYAENNWGMGYSKNMEILRSREGYIRGATEQNEITKKYMIEKSIKAFCDNCPISNSCTSHNCDRKKNFSKALE